MTQRYTHLSPAAIEGPSGCWKLSGGEADRHILIFVGSDEVYEKRFNINYYNTLHTIDVWRRARYSH